MDRNRGTINAASKLWNDLFADRQFYAFEFLRNYKIKETTVDFYCAEAQFIVYIEDRPTRAQIRVRNAFKKEVESTGYKFVVLSKWEIDDQYSEVIRLLDREFISQSRFQCG